MSDRPATGTRRVVPGKSTVFSPIVGTGVSITLFSSGTGTMEYFAKVSSYRRVSIVVKPPEQGMDVPKAPTEWQQGQGLRFCLPHNSAPSGRKSGRSR